MQSAWADIELIRQKSKRPGGIDGNAISSRCAGATVGVPPVGAAGVSLMNALLIGVLGYRLESNI